MVATRDSVFGTTPRKRRFRGAFGATGGVVTTAGIVFGITMFALASSSVLSIAHRSTRPLVLTANAQDNAAVTG